jgi:glycosidase
MRTKATTLSRRLGMVRSRTFLGCLTAVVAGLFACLPATSDRAFLHGADGASPQNNLVYEVFVRSFCSSDTENHPSGDLQGIARKLDSYLNDGDPGTDHDLEVGILWLMPIFPASSYHGYDVTDYRAINPEYGTLDDFKTLLQQAHRRGVRIILDVPFNHTSNEHPWFQEAVRNRESLYRTYYHFQPDDGSLPMNWHRVRGPGGERLRYFGLFSPKMPDLDFDNPRVRQEVKAIAGFWLDLGVDGFRLDAAKHIYGDRFDQLRESEIRKNNDWWLEFSESVYRKKPEAVLLGEVIDNYEILRRHAWGLDGLTDEPFMNNLRAHLGSPKPGFLTPHRQFLNQAQALHRTAYAPPLGHPFRAFDYVANHDRNPRLASDLEERKRHGMPYEVDQAYRLAVSILLTLSSRPILYQGDELMQRGWKWNGNPKNAPQNPGDGSGIYDETLREPFPWYRSGKGPGQASWFAPRFYRPNDGTSREEQDQDRGMLDLVRGLTHLRARHPALADGDLGEILNDSTDWMVFEKVRGREHYLVLVNLTGTNGDYKFHTQWYPQYRGAQRVFWSDGKSKKWQDTTRDNQRIQDSVTVPPFGLVVLRQV